MKKIFAIAIVGIFSSVGVSMAQTNAPMKIKRDSTYTNMNKVGKDSMMIIKKDSSMRRKKLMKNNPEIIRKDSMQ